ncbi:hypothetical protein DICPUDRAFT_159090 [Dictyostelium purpureum]|uniref:DUF4050 domain-containing protein n=1 Tax=Dictyostelium purpureum TaxID=5786 RepID=F1A394_DICPU|nr:uncharacterized protein DICPUDRAFT_159090 [Dictyostelium purpureum]EGC29334.1 hypothetical protein DICPUDRAFT_159090 [Dictyostelium purpureum]|eukprot:XP_003294137.1 hypothetical protein DICPUDRAFT_159090 [Dictyostelium purpureum]
MSENNNTNNNNTNSNNNNIDNENKEWVNIGYENWKRINKQWRESISTNPTNASNKYKSVDAVTITEEFLNKNGAFSKRVPLPDLVAILSEEWENEEN